MSLYQEHHGLIGNHWAWFKNLYQNMKSKFTKEESTATLHVVVKMIKIDWLFARQGYSKNGNDFL
jgi:hypothetical protein